MGTAKNCVAHPALKSPSRRDSGHHCKCAATRPGRSHPRGRPAGSLVPGDLRGHLLSCWCSCDAVVSLEEHFTLVKVMLHACVGMSWQARSAVRRECRTSVATTCFSFACPLDWRRVPQLGTSIGTSRRLYCCPWVGEKSYMEAAGEGGRAFLSFS